MRFILTPVGSAGDVHPFIGIGRTLKARGYDVIVVTAEPFGDPIRNAGLEFHQAGSTEEFDRITQDPDLWHPRRGLRIVLREVAAQLRRRYECLKSLYVPGSTVLVGHSLSVSTRLFEEVHKTPATTIHLAPSIFRSDYAQPAYAPGRDGSNWPRWVKRTLWWAIDRFMIDANVASALNDFRRELGLPPVTRVFREWIHSPQRVIGLFPEWFAAPQPDWPPALRLTGFPLYDEAAGSEPRESLKRFLHNGTPPILFTPGSANQWASRFFEAAIDASARLGKRALLLTRYAHHLPPMPPHAHHESFVPLANILPRCAALVSHGGIGTVAQGLAAGVPQLMMPIGFDQPDNATRIERLGAGRWLQPTRFDGPRVAAALDALFTDARTASSCSHWASEIRRRSPIDETCDALEQLAR